jgi:hypothetical protein
MRTITALALAGTIGSTALAGPINPNHVAADATWVAHVDLDALRGSRLVQAIEDVNDAFQEINDQIAGEFDIDLQADLAGVTAFGRGEMGDEEGVDGVVLYGTAGLQEVIRLIEQEVPDHTRRSVGDRLVYEFAIDDDEAYASLHVDVAETRRPNNAAISPWTLHVAPTRNKRSTLDALVADNAGGNALAIDAPRGAMVYLAANNLDALIGHDDDPASRFLSSSESLTLTIAETDGEFSFYARLVTADEQTANDLLQMANGFLAMARMAGGDDPQVQAALDLSRHMLLTADGRVVELGFSAPVDELVESINILNTDVHVDYEDDDDGVEIRIEKDVQLNRQ